MSGIRKIVGLVVASAALGATTTGTARAQSSDSDRQIAQSLFDDGRALMEAGHYAEACPKFADSHRLDPGGGTLLNLALCHEQEGKTATAWSEFRDALSLAMRDQRKDRQELAELHIGALGPKLTRLAVVVPTSIASRNPEITFDRSRLPDAAWNTAIPVDPGDHRIAVTVQGLSPWETSLATSEAGRTYTVVVPLLDRVDGGTRALDCPSGTRREDQACRDALAPPARQRRSDAFWILLGGAGVSMVTSVVTGVMALDANAYAKNNCSEERAFCRTDDAKDAASRAHTLAWVSTTTMLASAGAGIVALLLPLQKTSPLAANAGFRMIDGAAVATLELTPRRWW